MWAAHVAAHTASLPWPHESAFNFKCSLTGSRSTASGTPRSGPRCAPRCPRPGWRDYSLFISPTGLVIGVCECDDFDAARRAMEETEVNARWQREMAPFFEGLGGQRPDEGLELLEEIFHLA